MLLLIVFLVGVSFVGVLFFFSLLRLAYLKELESDGSNPRDFCADVGKLFLPETFALAGLAVAFLVGQLWLELALVAAYLAYQLDLWRRKQTSPSPLTVFQELPRIRRTYLISSVLCAFFFVLLVVRFVLFLVEQNFYMLPTDDDQDDQDDVFYRKVWPR